MKQQQQQHNPNPNPNPKSCTKLRRRDPSKSWSNLPGDLLNSVFERLGLADSRRVESVCRSWCSAARQCSAKKQIPWLIILPDEEDKIERHWCTLFNPEEKGKLYRMRADVYEFANSACLATHGNWLLMVDHWSDLYLLNLFTHEKIYLPEVESQLGKTKLERTSSRGRFCLSNDQLHRPMKLKGINEIMHSPVFWIDEETKEYVVVWALGEWCVVYSKKGDAFWNQIQMPPLPDFTERFFDMVYKDDKLYLLLHTGRRGRSTGFIKIFDFSTQIPQETFHCGVTSNNNTSDSDSDSWRVWATKLVVTVTGHVLKVEKLAKLVNPGGQGGPLRLWSFRVYKHHDEPVASLGHEAMLFDLGFTVLADDHLVGFKSNSIYFNVICQKQNTTQICVFNLDTQEMEEPLPKFVCSSWQQRLRARWFLPSFKHT